MDYTLGLLQASACIPAGCRYVYSLDSLLHLFPFQMVSKFAQAKKVMSQVLTQPSAPAVASFLSPIQKTALTLPAAAFLMPMALPGFATLYTYACVSSEPDAQCLPSAVQASERMRPLCCDHRAVINYARLPVNKVIWQHRRGSTHLALLHVVKRNLPGRLRARNLSKPNPARIA